MKASRYKPPRTYGWHATHDELEREFAAWGIRDWEARPNVMLSRANSEAVTRAERTVNLTFRKGEQTITLSMGDYPTATENLKVLQLCVNNLRMIERRGLTDTMQAAYLQLAAPVAGDPYRVLGVSRTAALDEIEAMYRAKAKKAHPDLGGSEDEMRALNAAIEAIRAERAVAA